MLYAHLLQMDAHSVSFYEFDTLEIYHQTKSKLAKLLKVGS